MQSANQLIRESLKAEELDSKLQEVVAHSDLSEKDRATVLSWIRAVRDECSGALRKAQDYSDLISRLTEFQLRAGLFELLSIREPDRAIKQKVQAELLNQLQEYIRDQIQANPEGSHILESLQSNLAALMPAFPTITEQTAGPEGPLLVVETDYKQDTYQLSDVEGPVHLHRSETDEGSGSPESAGTDQSSMEGVSTEVSEGLAAAEVTGSDDAELEQLRAENQELRQKLNDFLEEWGEGIRIDGKTVSILTHRKIIVKKNSQSKSEGQ
ncbi:MAG: hypothetical protein CMN76_19120 [Spirochaetaceae bacterium]|nr:hypothetical protein [Spirochaetaceae bacterium]|tara:strand:+ start:85069 stop:85875 length:807 start_codon:yes stop_codon:yes gene_type:complete